MASQTISFATNRDELKNAQGITIGFGDKLNPVSPAYPHQPAAEHPPDRLRPGLPNGHDGRQPAILPPARRGVADICAVLDGARPEAIRGRAWLPARGAFVVAARP